MWVILLLGVLAWLFLWVKSRVSKDIDEAVTWDAETTQFHDWREIQKRK